MNLIVLAIASYAYWRHMAIRFVDVEYKGSCNAALIVTIQFDWPRGKTTVLKEAF